MINWQHRKNLIDDDNEVFGDYWNYNAFSEDIAISQVFSENLFTSQVGICWRRCMLESFWLDYLG